MSPSPSASPQVVREAKTSESVSPSMSSPATRLESSSRAIEGDEAMAVNPAVVLNVSSFFMSKPRTPALVRLPTIWLFTHEVWISFHRSNERWKAAVASARVRNGAPRGFGMVAEKLFIRYCTGMQRTSQRKPMTWPPASGARRGTLPVTSMVSGRRRQGRRLQSRPPEGGRRDSRKGPMHGVSL
jgi:hypothetical protein